MRRALPALLACLALASAPAGGHAATRHVVDGAGFGHGIGMSQYGAYGFAAHGRTYRRILAHYYRGTRLGRAQTDTIRVLLQSGRGQGAFRGATRAAGERLDARRTYTVHRIGSDRVELRTSDGRRVGRFAAPLRVSGEGRPVRLLGGAINSVRDGLYRGALEFRPSISSDGITAVNAASLDDYVQGVVPGEVPASWPSEALKSQAVAARSYALATNRGGGVFDQYPDTRSQVYRGVTAEHPRTNAAVRATAREVLRYGGAIATTFFFSTSGGRTENVENVFYGAAPKRYLVSVPDPYDDASPVHRWRVAFSQAAMESRLSGYVRGTFQRIEVVRRGVSPRIVRAVVVGSGGRTQISGATLRFRLGLRDTWAFFRRITTKALARSRGKSWFARLVGPWEIAGRIAPRPRRGRMLIERRSSSGRWHALGRRRTDRRGGYRVRVPAPGVYRVRANGVAGPAVRVG